jgi:hypothetical protein
MACDGITFTTFVMKIGCVVGSLREGVDKSWWHPKEDFGSEIKRGMLVRDCWVRKDVILKGRTNGR